MKIYICCVLVTIFQFMLTPMHCQNNTTQAKYMANVDCGPHIHYVGITKTFQHIPYTVKLHRCYGKTDSRQLTQCLPNAIQNVPLLVTKAGGTLGNVSVQNYTNCHEQCLLNASYCSIYQQWHESDCSCRCIQSTPPSDCVSPSYWEKSTCSCRCPYNAQTYPCGSQKEFSLAACGCLCKPWWSKQCAKENKYLDQTTCGCVNKTIPGSAFVGTEQCMNDKSKIILTLTVIFEAIAMVAIFFLWNQYSELIKRHCCSQRTKKITFRENNDNNAESDRSSLNTPTIKMEPLVEEAVSTVTPKSKSLYLFKDSFNRGNKYRYEMENAAPIFCMEKDNSILTPNKLRYSFNSDDTFSRVSDSRVSDSLASVTQV